MTKLVWLYWAPATALSKSIAHFKDGSPATQVGVLINAVITEVETTTSDKRHSEAATDPDLPAKEGQARQRAPELLTG